MTMTASREFDFVETGEVKLSCGAAWVRATRRSKRKASVTITSPAMNTPTPNPIDI
jgi:hypothetical protein